MTFEEIIETIRKQGGQRILINDAGLRMEDQVENNIDSAIWQAKRRAKLHGDYQRILLPGMTILVGANGNVFDILYLPLP